MNNLKFKLPEFNVYDENESSKNIQRFSIKPLERGYGITLGTALRRALLASIPGAAIVNVKIDGVKHEFSVIEGVYEDVVRIVLNLKKVIVKVDSEDDDFETKLYINAYGPCEVTAADFSKEDGVEIINPDLHIASLAHNAKLNMEVTIRRGLGYSSAEKNKQYLRKKGYEEDSNFISIDALFSPVVRVSFNVDKLMNDEDDLLIEVETNGAIEPKDALAVGGKILVEYFESIVKISDKAANVSFVGEVEKHHEAPKEKELVDDETQIKLNSDLEILDLPTRSTNALKRGGVETVGDLVKRSLRDIEQFVQISKESAKKISEKLEANNLSLSKTDYLPNNKEEEGE